MLDGHEWVVRPLPVFHEIIVVVDHHHQSAVIIAHSQVLRDQAPVIRGNGKQVRNIIKASKDRVVARQFLERTVRKGQFQLAFEILQLRFAAKVIDNQKPTPKKILAQISELLFREVKESYLAKVGDWELEYLPVLEGNNVSVRIHIELGDLRHDFHEVLFPARIVVTPRRTLPAPAKAIH